MPTDTHTPEAKFPSSVSNLPKIYTTYSPVQILVERQKYYNGKMEYWRWCIVKTPRKLLINPDFIQTNNLWKREFTEECSEEAWSLEHNQEGWRARGTEDFQGSKTLAQQGERKRCCHKKEHYLLALSGVKVGWLTGPENVVIHNVPSWGHKTN